MINILLRASRHPHCFLLAWVLVCLPLSVDAGELGLDGAHDRDLSAWELQYSPYTYHFSPDPEHKHVWLIGIAKIREDGWLAGGAFFRNSFGQPCGYGFVGHKYVEPWGLEHVYWSWTAGVIYGYKAPYEDKVPLNVHGFSPGFVPTIGYQVTPHAAVQLALLGNSGVMVNFVFDMGQGRK